MCVTSVDDALFIGFFAVFFVEVDVFVIITRLLRTFLHIFGSELGCSRVAFA